MKKMKNRATKRAPDAWTGLFFLFSSFSLLILPLIHSQKTMDITLMPRLLAWTAFLFLLSLAFLSKGIYKQLDFSVLRKRVFAVLVIYFFISLISLLSATNIKAGFYDLVKTFSFLLFTVYACFIFLNTPLWSERLTRVFVAGALVSIIIGYFQYVSHLGFGIHSRGQMTGLKLLMSNVNMYASYLMMMLPFVIYGSIILKGAWRRLAIVVLVMCLILIMLLQTRAVYLGIMLGLPAAGILLLLLYKRFHIPSGLRNRIALYLLGAVIVVAGGISFLPQDHVIKNRVVSMFGDTENPRLLIWKTSVKLVADNPLLGVGAGNFHIRLPEYAGSSGLGEHGVVWMRPHNDYIWVASEKGLFGLLSFLGIFFLAFYYIWRIIFSESQQKEKLLAVLIFMGLIAYMVNAFFDFPLERVNQQVILGIYLAVLICLTHTNDSAQPTRKNPPGKGLMIAILFLTFVGVLYSMNAIKLEKNISIARQANAVNNWSVMLGAVNDAKTPWNNIDPIGNPVYMYECLAYMGLNDVSKALAACQEARKVSPNRRNVLLPLGYIYLSTGQYDEAIGCMDQILQIHPKDPMALTVIGGAYHRQGNLEQAMEALKRIPRGDRLDETVRLMETIRQEQQENEQTQ